jgi:ribose/xylose/arabinose/galactoside ABC-type transport system permease subunit
MSSSENMASLYSQKSWREHLNAFGPVIGLVVVYGIFLLVAPSSFYSLYNTKTFMTQAVIYGIGAIGMTFVIISGGIDLSVGSLIALGSVVTAMILRTAGAEEIGLILPILASLSAVVACALCGMLSGALVSYMRIVPFIVTLGMMQITRGVAKGLAGQTAVNTSDNWLGSMMVIEPQVGKWYSVAPGLWVMVVLLIFMTIFLRRTAFGRYVCALGSNEATARLCGINVSIQRIWVYTLCGALTGCASVMQYASLSLGDPTAAVGMELDIIAAVVIGGGSLNGGEGSVVGSLLGAIIMAILRNGCVLVGIPNYVQNIVIGTIIVAAVGIDRLRHKSN